MLTKCQVHTKVNTYMTLDATWMTYDNPGNTFKNASVWMATAPIKFQANSKAYTNNMTSDEYENICKKFVSPWRQVHNANMTSDNPGWPDLR